MNKTIKCLIVDDEPLAIDLIKSHINQVPQLEIVTTCQNAMEAFELLKRQPIDLLFLDIQMPVITGIEFMKSLSQVPSVILTTAHRQYAVESYELDVMDYLVKPITFGRFFKAINKYLNNHGHKQIAQQSITFSSRIENYIYVQVNKKHVKVLFDRILFVESIKDYIRIHTTDQRIITKDKISDFEKKLPDTFLRIHRSYIINMTKITAFTANDIEINDREIPIGISYKRQVLERLK